MGNGVPILPKTAKHKLAHCNGVGIVISVLFPGGNVYWRGVYGFDGFYIWRIAIAPALWTLEYDQSAIKP